MCYKVVIHSQYLSTCILLLPLLSTAEKESFVRSDDYGRDLSTVQTLLTKQETFDAGLQSFEKEGIQQITTLKDKLVASDHAQTQAIQDRHASLIKR